MAPTPAGKLLPALLLSALLVIFCESSTVAGRLIAGEGGVSHVWKMTYRRVEDPAPLSRRLVEAAKSRRALAKPRAARPPPRPPRPPPPPPRPRPSPPPPRPPPPPPDYQILAGNISRKVYSVEVELGSPPSPYDLILDTGSDLMWVNCAADDQVALQNVFNPVNSTVVDCESPFCEQAQVGSYATGCTGDLDRTCQYDYTYQSAAVSGFLLETEVSVNVARSSPATAPLVVGCTAPESSDEVLQYAADGVLGLGSSALSLPQQLANATGISPIFGHCLGEENGGYFFVGPGLVPRSRIGWTAMQGPLEPFTGYFLSARGVYMNDSKLNVSARIITRNPLAFGYDELVGGFKLDTGSTLNSFSEPLFSAIKDELVTAADASAELIQEDVVFAGEVALLCWLPVDGSDIVSSKRYIDIFPKLAITFKRAKFQWTADEYLQILTSAGHLCFATKNAGPIDFGYGISNTLGAVLLRDAVIVYDLEKKMVGWRKANCSLPPSIRR